MVLGEAVGSEWLVFSHAFHLMVTIGKRVLKYLSSSFSLFSHSYQDRLCHDRHDFLFYNFLCYLIPRFGFVGVLYLLSISRLLFFSFAFSVLDMGRSMRSDISISLLRTIRSVWIEAP